MRISDWSSDVCSSDLSSLCRTTPWRSLELVKHHRALGLATAPLDVTCGIDIANGSPAQPVTLVRPHAAARAARFFVEKFPGRSMYAVQIGRASCRERVFPYV